MKHLFLLVIAGTLSLQLNGQTHWTKHPDNPIFLPGAAGEWDEDGVMAVSVLFYDNTYHMWYNNRDLKKDLDPEDTLLIGYATSDDGIHWNRHPENPVLSHGPAGSWDENFAFNPVVLIRNGLLHMWYMGHRGTDSNLGYQVGYATSTDGVHWIKHENNPVLTSGPTGSWDAGWVGNGPVVFTDSLFHMWYMGWDGVLGDLITGHASSPDGIHWTKDANHLSLVKFDMVLIK